MIYIENSRSGRSVKIAAAPLSSQLLASCGLLIVKINTGILFSVARSMSCAVMCLALQLMLVKALLFATAIVSAVNSSTK